MGESKLLEAARLNDPVEHTFSFAGAIIGALAGLVVGAAIVFATVAAVTATVATGGAALLIIGAVGTALSVTAFGSSLGETLGKFIPNSCDGVMDGARTVFIGSPHLNAARANDPVKCHSGQK